MGKLIISGGGSEKQTEAIDLHFASLLDKNRTLLYIPVAMASQQVSYDGCYKWITDIFHPMGIRSIEMWTDIQNKCYEDIQTFSGIYIGGGNTFDLLDLFEETQFSDLIKEYVNHGGVVYGGSAGGIILGSHIKTCALNDHKPGYEGDYKGLDLIGPYAIHCHYEQSQHSFIQSLVHEYNVSVIALPEETGLSMIDDEMTVIGEKWAVLFDDKGWREVGVGSTISDTGHDEENQ
ncbi:Type 1 glutamine amidotransferase-like domain-containing protein [Rossellomorea aquimaris]|uniref:Type 1 glutamine amidotransferase-like domain-containing protein n=1 Tax=Rossellomorea aquimaris TaxID=189382 RepID=UPI001CD36815|nr:Type 1 glutamine amidotransferase-like domain-containing protein [Rossellomorea aquimaris]MCA1053700.1 Type 1 glutamine amidotransferase-like domain-containing protein [Rossellomorea aquimaris]